MSGAKVLWIVLEGVPLSFLRRSAGAGLAPFLGEFLHDAATAWTKSALPAPLPTWGDALTGAPASRHRIFDEIKIPRDPSASPSLYAAADLGAETLFSAAARSGATVTALNFPLTAPAEEWAGCAILPGGLAKRHLSRQSAPRDLLVRLKSAPGLNADLLAVSASEESDAIAAWEAGDPQAWIELQSGRDAHWRIAAEWLLKNQPADLFALNLTGLGEILRLEGGWMEESSDLESSPLKDALRSLDEGVQSLIRAAGPGAKVFAGSPYLFHPAKYVFYLNALMEKDGFLVWNESAPPRDRRSDGLNGPFRRAALPPVDLSRTAAFCASGSSGSVRFSPAFETEEAGAIRAETLLRRLAEIQDPQIERPLLRRAARPDEWFGDLRSEIAPDLYAVPSEGVALSPERGETVLKKRQAPIGVPTSDGWLAGSGGETGLDARDRSVLDLAPTLLYALDAPIPADWEGEPILNLFDPAHRERHPVKTGMKSRSVAATPEATADDLTDADEKIYERLKSLGYVE
jgi:predicted AlkP superfamily phosphohydrolase/phosphomutase